MESIITFNLWPGIPGFFVWRTRLGLQETSDGDGCDSDTGMGIPAELFHLLSCWGPFWHDI